MFKKYGRSPHYLWGMLNPLALWTADALRERFGTTTINSWLWGGRYKESGLRDFNTTTGAKLSQHKFGNADDCKFKNATPEEVRQDIKANPDRDCYKFITCVEEGTKTWFHFDVRNHENVEVLESGLVICRKILWVPA